jgi:hypothetical protein
MFNDSFHDSFSIQIGNCQSNSHYSTEVLKLITQLALALANKGETFQKPLEVRFGWVLNRYIDKEFKITNDHQEQLRIFSLNRAIERVNKTGWRDEDRILTDILTPGVETAYIQYLGHWRIQNTMCFA